MRLLVSVVSSYIICTKQCILALNVANWYLLSHCLNVLSFTALCYSSSYNQEMPCLNYSFNFCSRLAGESVVSKPPHQTEEGPDQGHWQRSSSTSESLATCNILRLLEQGHLLSVPAPPPNPLLAHPHVGNGSLLGSPSYPLPLGWVAAPRLPGQRRAGRSDCRCLLYAAPPLATPRCPTAHPMLYHASPGWHPSRTAIGIRLRILSVWALHEDREEGRRVKWEEDGFLKTFPTDWSLLPSTCLRGLPVPWTTGRFAN